MLKELKLLLGIADDSLDEKLLLIIATATARLKVLLGGVEPPDSLDYIVREVSIIRFNKIGSEGMRSQTIEGESMTFDDNDFSGFMDEIQAYLESQKESARGKVRFL
jgi:hypothetical protein